MVVENRKLAPPDRSRPIFVVVDGNHLIHRAFYAIKTDLTSSSGEPTNAIFGFIAMLFNIIDLEKPDYLAIAFDEKGPTFRHEAHEDYKATRTKAPDELYAQIPRIWEMVRSLKVPIFSEAGFEADDLIGSLVRKTEAEGMDSLIITGDMDAMQLISPHVCVITPHKGYREPIVYDAERVHLKYGVRPNQIVDYKALMGDTSDNIKGVEGIGPKRAHGLLAQYNTLEGIYEHLDAIPEVLRSKLIHGKEDAFFARYLAQIITDVNCCFVKEDADLSHFDFDALSQFLASLDIRSLQRRIERIAATKKKASIAQMSLF